MPEPNRAAGLFTAIRIQTADGAELCCKRKPADGEPVLFLHGLAVNADLWDIPEMDLPGGRYQSLASLLHAAGFDVWLLHFRGLGPLPDRSRPPSGQTDWCVDHFIHYDLPAAIERVRSDTGRQPFLLGNSMGAMVAAAYLQGARLDETPAPGRIVCDPATAAVRQLEIAGCVLIEFPAALRWPKSMYDEQGALNWRELAASWRGEATETNFPFEWLARSGWLQAVVRASGGVRLDRLRPGANRTAGSAFWPPGWTEQALTGAMRFYSERIKGRSTSAPSCL